MITAEEKLKRLVYNEELKNGAIIQETPICPRCLEIVNIMDKRVSVEYFEIKIGERAYKLAEPICPLCGEFIPARYHMVH